MANESTEEPTDFFAALVQDHARMEARLKSLDAAAAAASNAEGDIAALGVIAGTLAYFATEGARHEEHEELTLFPRLRPLSGFEQLLSAFQFQHRMNEDAGRQLSACVESFGPGSGRELRQLAYRFIEMHRGHAFAEERALFPLATAQLSREVVAEMGREMRDRERKAGSARES